MHKKITKITIFILVLLFTFILRTHNYDRMPLFGHLEEMLYGWSGINLIETGVPVSWSTLDYPDRAEVFRGKLTYKGGKPFAFVRLYKPWLDEPPLFSLLVGSFAHFYGASRNDVIPTSYIRLPMMAIAVFTSIMVFLVARLAGGYWLGILSMLIYGTTPVFVVASRLAVPENLIALTFMVTIYLLLKFKKSLQVLYILPIPLLAGLSGLSKPTGFFILFLALYVVFASKFYKTFFLMAISILPFVGLFIWYGLHFDADIFWRMISIQGFRPVGFSSLAWFFVSPAYDIIEVTDSWYIFALLSSAFFIFLCTIGKKISEGLLNEEKVFLMFALVFWLVVVMLSGGEGDLLPWYRYPLFPLMAISAALGVGIIVKKANFFATFLSAGMFLGGRHLLVNAFRPNVTPLQYRLIFSGLMMPAVFQTFLQKEWLNKFCRMLIIITIAVGIYFNVVYIYNQFELECESKTCPFGPSTNLSTIYFPFFRKFILLGEPTYH